MLPPRPLARTIAILVAALSIGIRAARVAARIGPTPGAASCALSDLTIARFPLDGVNGRDWVITNYVDLDATSPGVRDYQGHRGQLARTYDGHTGIDIDIPSFREMDSGAAVIHAAAAGVVDEVIQDAPDRNTSCTGRWNVVRVRSANGFEVVYGHIKRHSAMVAAGDAVDAGTPLAIAGSAGCSPQPHLHFEVRDCANAAVETLAQAGVWSEAPVYDPVPGVLEVVLREGTAPTVAQIKDPAGNLSAIAAPGRLGVGLSAAVHGGDVIAVRLIDPRGAATTRTFTVGGGARYSHWYVGFAFAVRARATGAAGARATGATIWHVEARIDGVVAATRTLLVTDASRRPVSATAAACSRRSSRARSGGWRPRTDRSRPAF